MILGMSLATFTQFHVITSLIAIISGLAVVLGMMGAKRMPGMTALFLITSVVTSATGFMFPTPFDAADVVGIICFVLVVQSFLKIPFFHALAPTQKEPPFAAAQGVVLILFIALGVAALKRFRPLAQAPAIA